MSAMAAAIVERSLLPNLRLVSLTRVPAVRQPSVETLALAESVELQEPLELVEDAGCVGREDAHPDGDDGTGPAEHAGNDAEALARMMGVNLLIGGAYGFFGRLLRPRIDQLARRSGRFSSVVKVLGESCTFGLAYGIAAMSKDAGACVGELMTRVPVLGNTGVFGRTIQWSLATMVGSKLGEALMVQPERSDTPVFLANMCVMCNAHFVVGGGQRVAALSCGHACMCNEAFGSCGETCASSYLQQRSECPLCREQDVYVLHELRV